MKALLFSLLIAAACTAADAPSLAGKWQVHASIGGNEYEMACTFTQKDDALSGTCVSEQGTSEISGNIAGNKVAWSYKSEYNGTPLTVKFDGALDSATKMKGSVSVPEFGAEGEFSAIPAK